ncbi:MAG: hypothetical protein U1A25_03440 [Candidatus Sungbacteria bacterium]|nr:hypothetical protein [bacterium]MDZ4260697.1 hypothetical protein [Candidatus Sungbacteria bacterium]
MKNTSLTYFIIQKMGELGETTVGAFFPKKYVRTHLSRQLFGLESYPSATSRTVISLLSRLKRQGLVERHGVRGKSSWALTFKGRQWLQEKNNKEFSSFVAPPDGVARLVIFDIPEYDRRKRDVIRAELISCNFQKLQRSVWIGYNPLPENFIELIDTLHLKGNVHLFSVREFGTLTKRV